MGTAVDFELHLQEGSGGTWPAVTINIQLLDLS